MRRFSDDTRIMIVGEIAEIITHGNVTIIYTYATNDAHHRVWKEIKLKSRQIMLYESMQLTGMNLFDVLGSGNRWQGPSKFEELQSMMCGVSVMHTCNPPVSHPSAAFVFLKVETCAEHGQTCKYKID